MKRFITVVFAAMMAITLSAPAWSQAAGSKTQTKAAANNAKEEKKAAKAKAKSEKKSKKDTKAKK